MQRLLRSVFQADSRDDRELMLGNALELRQSKLDFLIPEHDAIWSYISQFVSDHNHVPDHTSLHLHFTQTEVNPDAVNQLQLIRSLEPITRGDFKKRLNIKVEERRTRETEDLLNYANQINRTGVQVQDGPYKSDKSVLKGYRDALKHVVSRAMDIIRPLAGIRKEGEVTTDTKQFVEDYDRRRDDPSYGIGQLCGIGQIDDTTGGARKDQLWTHAAFTGELKCVTSGTLIQDVETGALHTVEEMYRKGLHPLVQCLDESAWKTTTARVEHVEQNAVVPIFKVSTNTGRVLRVSGNHPFRAVEGWKNAEDLKAKQDFLAAPEKWPLGIEDLLRKCDGDVIWEMIEAVEPDGFEMTYDLSVPGHANFVANGLVVHNSTYAFNWVYIQAIYLGKSSCFFSLEMPYEQCQRIIYTMHSRHEKFVLIRQKLGLQLGDEDHTCLTYEYIRDGKLPPNEERFLKEAVLPDLERNAANGNYGKMHFRGYDPDSDTFTVSDIRNKGETLYRESPFSLLVVDHVLLVDSKKAWRSVTESANEVVRDLKKLSEVFNSGEGIAVLALFQISREGKKRADKAGGRYSLYDLSYSNEIERSSDIITASYLDDNLRKQCLAYFQFLKSRDGGMCEPFYVRVEWACRMLFTCYASPVEDADALVAEVEGTPYDELVLE